MNDSLFPFLRKPHLEMFEEPRFAALKIAHPVIQQNNYRNPSYLTSPDLELLGKDGKVMPEQEDEVPKDKEEGLDRWKFEMTMRFLKGEDPDFDYKTVDENEELDVIERAEEEERWFEDEEPSWVDENTAEGTGGETGILDY
ncbi:putative Coiled-coil domain-containing protein 97 [Glarea lozoyensis 74030]|uniref:Putative Coiled-coil domain-containing protein 97 n=1 Tax=Glarea lozoyensis (strain ATCC 74030 / MF5533) TaxID=1104152 RepID=H0EMX2_GLAL7|nr:putative Coiled-coil domain-containing protein 97 [Glarea lozoyensis 74030]